MEKTLQLNPPYFEYLMAGRENENPEDNSKAK